MSARRLATPLFLVLAASLASCAGADLPLSPTTPSPPIGGWSGSWSASVGETTLRLNLSRRLVGEFWDSYYQITGLGTLTPAGSGGAPIPLSTRGSTGWISKMVLQIYDTRLPVDPAPGTVAPATLIATFRATFMSDTLLIGTLAAEGALLPSGEVSFRRR